MQGVTRRDYLKRWSGAPLVYSDWTERGGMTEWRQQAASAVEAELEHARQPEEWSLLGPLRRTDDGDYVVDLRGRRIRPLNDVRVAAPTVRDRARPCR